MDNERFNFKTREEMLTFGRLEMFTLTRVAGYFNAAATDLLLQQGKYIQFRADKKNQAFSVVVVDGSGIGTYRIFKQNGSTFPVERKFIKWGMDEGEYLYLGGNVFQHIDHLK